MPAHHQRSGPAAFCNPIPTIVAAYNQHNPTNQEFSRFFVTKNGIDIAQSSSHDGPENRRNLPALLGTCAGVGMQTVVWKHGYGVDMGMPPLRIGVRSQ
jgi:hypothetical protein